MCQSVCCYISMSPIMQYLSSSKILQAVMGAPNDVLNSSWCCGCIGESTWDSWWVGLEDKHLVVQYLWQCKLLLPWLSLQLQVVPVVVVCACSELHGHAPRHQFPQPWCLRRQPHPRWFYTMGNLAGSTVCLHVPYDEAFGSGKLVAW